MKIVKVKEVFQKSEPPEYYFSRIGMRNDLVISEEALSELEKIDPIRITYDGVTVYFIHFKFETESKQDEIIMIYHRLDGPAIKGEVTGEKWVNYGKYHNESGPAVISPNTNLWFIDGKLHRIGGPAYIDSLGGSRRSEYFLKDFKFHEEDYEKLIQNKFNIGDLVICESDFWADRYNELIKHTKQNPFRFVCEVVSIEACNDGFWPRALTLKKENSSEVLPFRFYDFELIAIDPEVHKERYSMGVLDVCMQLHIGANGGCGDFISDEINKKLINFLQYRIDTWQNSCCRFDQHVKELILATIDLYKR